MTLLMVTVAGAAGVAARYGISNLFHGDLLPWATVGINVIGSFLLGLLIVMPLAWVDPEARVALGVGFLGGLTTFSALGVEGFQLLRANRIDLFAWTMLAHVVAGALAVAAGWKLGQVTFVH